MLKIKYRFLGIAAGLLVAGVVIALPVLRTPAQPGPETQSRAGHQALPTARLTAPFATPAGITLQPLGKAQGYSLDKESAAKLARDRLVFADSRGMTLYTYRGDTKGKSSCNAECSATFPPLAASSLAAPFGDWSVIDRDDGTRQWALEGKPLYTYEKDVDPGSVAGNSPAATGAPRLDGAGKPVGGGYRGGFKGDLGKRNVLPQGWNPAYLDPLSRLRLPPGVAVRELPDGAAFALVDHHNHTLYVYQGSIGGEGLMCPDDSCVDRWAPFAAPLIARPMGEFDVFDRDDGIRQWTFRGKGLYTFSGDLAPGFANGVGLDENWSVAAVYRLYHPAGVTVERTLSQGAVLASGGMTLYRRDGHILQSGGGHNLRRGQPPRPAVGRDIGTDPRCGAKCEEVWQPFLAPDEAEARGFWAVSERGDGRKQWVYQGYALWTYSGDRQIGDMRGHDVYDIVLSHNADTVVDIGTPMDGGAALWWSIAVP